MCGPPPPIRSGGSGGPVPPLKLGAGALSSDSSRPHCPVVKELNCRVEATATGAIKQLVMNSSRESKESFETLVPIQTPSLPLKELEKLTARSTPDIEELTKRVLSELDSPSSETSSESPDSPKRSRSTERIVDETGRNFDVTITTETAPAFIGTGRGGISLYGPPITTTQLTIEQVTDIRPNTNPQMNSPAMETFIIDNIGPAHLQEAKDLFSSVIRELGKSPDSKPLCVDLQCGGKQFRLVFDKIKNQALLFNREHFVEGTEKTVHDAISIPIPTSEGAPGRSEIRSRAVLCTKPLTEGTTSASFFRRELDTVQNFYSKARGDSRLNHIIAPYESEYQSSNGHLMISTEKLSGDIVDELCKLESSIKDFQTHLIEGCKGLSLIHDLGFVHCDATLTNMFLKGNSCKVGDLSTCRASTSPLPQTSRAIDPFVYPRGSDTRPYDIFCLGQKLQDRELIALLKAKPQTAESAAFIIRLEELSKDMTKENPAERPTIHEVIARLKG